MLNKLKRVAVLWVTMIAAEMLVAGGVFMHDAINKGLEMAELSHESKKNKKREQITHEKHSV